MTVLVTCGYQKTWCDFAQTRLRQMGIDDPTLSQRSGFSPHELTDKMCSIHKLEVEGADSVEQVTPGKAWQITAADLFVANADQEIWGWADNRNIFFLDFWRDFDPMCKFVLVYGSPAESIACNLGEQTALPEDINAALDGWISYHEQLLRFYQEYPDQCLLVHIDLFGKTAKGVTKKLVDRFDVPARRVNSFQDMPQTAVLQLIADRLLGGREQDHELMAELESSADLPGLPHAASNKVSLQAHQEFIESRQVLFSERKLETSRLQEKLDRVSSQIAMQSKNSSEKNLESDLLQKQLHQAQSELELYFGKYQKLRAEARAKPGEAQKPAQPVPAHQGSSNITIDLRSYVNGTGWHAAEEHGRWAGPGRVSTIKFPRLVPGRYRLELEMVDAMSLAVAKNIVLELDEQKLATSTRIFSNIGGRLAPIRRIKATLQKVEKPYPISTLANVSINGIRSQAADHTLSLTCPETVTPSSKGQLDTRALSVCVKTINLVKVS